MEQMNVEKKQQRKKYAGESSQKMVSFRLDNDLAEWLAGKPNKGRYLNNLIRADLNDYENRHLSDYQLGRVR